ncbi:33 kDa inner dynein arm light chain, axonemal-like [Centruroides vittatus]|uniref:33 kDa inner dynein arm light chain, axonemal-like n=1 Tax=Centruroides vittatus TaxID=120091 RepID=UPI00350EF56C
MKAAHFLPSLVKYDDPILISQKPEDETKEAEAIKPVSPTKGELSDVLIYEKKEDKGNILDCIIPPRKYKENDITWIQHVSTTLASREDVINLQEELNQKLTQNQARETGICFIRRKLYDECFDELIRQVTLHSTERGLLLLRVRDELRMTLSAYETLYESSVIFGTRKTLQAKQDIEETDNVLEKLRSTRETLNRQVEELTARCTMIEKIAKERRETDEKNYTNEIQFLKRVNQQLKAQFKRIVDTIK